MAKAGFTNLRGTNAVPAGYQQITTLNTAQSLTAPANKGGINACIIRAETQTVRWRDDGVAPTATVGTLLSSSDPPFEYTGDLSAIQFIETTASAKLNISYYLIEP